MIFALTLLAQRMRDRRARVEHAAALRLRAEDLMRRADMAQAQSDADYEAALRHSPETAERGRLECGSHEHACLSMAYISEAGGDHETARLHREAAAWWRVRKQQYAAAVEMDHA